jgi:hypothetical protein
VVQELVDYQPRQDGAQDVVQELADYQPRQDGAQDVVQELADYQLRYLTVLLLSLIVGAAFLRHFLPLALEYLQFHQRIQKQYRKPHQHTHLLYLGIQVLPQPDRQ